MEMYCKEVGLAPALTVPCFLCRLAGNSNLQGRQSGLFTSVLNHCKKKNTACDYQKHFHL